MIMSHQKILVGTQNRDKFREIEAILLPFSLEAISLANFPDMPDVEEIGQTYQENAILKARCFSKLTGLPCISDDTGLEVEALHGEPGLYSARWAGVEGSGRYKANNEKLLKQLEGVPCEHRQARFVCVIVLVQGEKLLLSCEGVCYGRIAETPRGQGGFGYDPLFELPEYGKTFAELGERKNKISHRAKAVALFAKAFAHFQETDSETGRLI
jgi:XTP/dITP diphosphohydrolase